MARWRSHFDRAVSHHRAAAGALETAEQLVAIRRPKDPEAEFSRRATVRLADSARAAATAAAPGWLGLAPDELRAAAPAGPAAPTPTAVRIGTAESITEQAVPVLLPTLGAGHVAIDRDARDRSAGAVLRGVTLRLVAALPAGSLRIMVVDAATAGALFVPFAPLVEAGILEQPATTEAGLGPALDAADRHMRTAQQSQAPYLLLVLTGLSTVTSHSTWARLAALAHAGPSARTHLLLSGVDAETSPLDHTTLLQVDSGRAEVVMPHSPGLPPRTRVSLDPDPPNELIAAVCRRQADAVTHAVGISALIPERIWESSAAHELRTPIGRDGPSDVDIVLGDSTPHCLIGGRTGSGKTVFLLDLLYGLAGRYSPDELMFYLLDFKEGVSFSEFTPSRRDESWLPHVRAIGVESDRHYGVAVLAELQAEMLRRSTEMKRTGTTRFSELREADPDLPLPRIVTVIDEFQVLFSGNDQLARRAVAQLEDIARKGRSYGIHLVLASQTTRGIEALYAKSESIFGQFALRIALAGASGVLDPLNTAAASIRVGSAIVNREGGIAEANERVSFPNAHADADGLADLRHRLWRARHPLNEAPAVFRGYAEYRVTDDAAYQLLRPGEHRIQLLVGRRIDVAQNTAEFPLDPSPGRHLAVIGPDASGAEIVHAAALSAGRQHRPGDVEFVITSLVAGADAIGADLAAQLIDLGHTPRRLPASELAIEIAAENPNRYLVVFGMDAASGILEQKLPTGRTGLLEFRRLLKSGPARGTHVLAWWRGSRRFSDDIGGSAGREDVACLVVLNIPAQELSSNLGMPITEYHPRPNRALLVDRHDARSELIVPFSLSEGHR
ncbi:MAG TPA: FtsK/SpoIIIE domain-containing protein [Mycobacteriales bacterium]|nr:FtsK/SpoIIIE domain-containing protein [Mycobacteriales bacterium]